MTNLDEPDELYEQAVEIVRSTGKASTALLQRRLKIGYARASRLIGWMEEEGVRGSENTGSARKLVDKL